MQKILEELYCGNITPCERSLPSNPEYKQTAAEVIRLENKLLSKLEDDGLYNSFQLASLKRGSMEDTQLFVDSFRLGAMFMMEILSGE